jgi:PAS domain-containing protein
MELIQAGGSPPATRCVHICRKASAGLGLLVCIGGAAVFLGWVFGVEALKSLRPGMATMGANTAASFFFSGLALWFAQFRRLDRPSMLLGLRLCVFAVLSISLLTACEFLFGWHPGIDQFIFREPFDARLTPHPGRMPLNSVFNFALIGLALALLGWKGAQARWPSVQLLMIPVSIVSLFSFVGFLYHAAPIQVGTHFDTAMALHTSLLFLGLGLGILLCRPDLGFLSAFPADSAGGMMMRRLFPVAVALPMFFGWLDIYGEEAGLFGNAFGVVFMATANFLLLALYLYSLSLELSKSEALHQESEFDRRMQFATSRDGILILDAQTGAILCANSSLARLSEFTLESLSGLRLSEIDAFSPLLRAVEAFLQSPPDEFVRRERLQLQTRSGAPWEVDLTLNFSSREGRRVVRCELRGAF